MIFLKNTHIPCPSETLFFQPFENFTIQERNFWSFQTARNLNSRFYQNKIWKITHISCPYRNVNFKKIQKKIKRKNHFWKNVNFSHFVVVNSWRSLSKHTNNLKNEYCFNFFLLEIYIKNQFLYCKIEKTTDFWLVTIFLKMWNVLVKLFFLSKKSKFFIKNPKIWWNFEQNRHFFHNLNGKL